MILAVSRRKGTVIFMEKDKIFLVEFFLRER